MKDQIKSLALEIGFHSVGITSAEPFVEAEATLRYRLELGLLDGSGYRPDNIHSRTHPTESLTSARSIISVAISYLTDDEEVHSTDNIPRGLMAKYSRGKDYHDAIQERLALLAAGIEKLLGRPLEVRSYADTGKLADRASAMRAGIGVPGKNTCIYVNTYGSWVVLGELITDVELEPDKPTSPDICGKCEKCMKACPTEAICAPDTIDVRKCLSRVTVCRGSIPIELRAPLGNRIYGCDICQSVCPLNQDARPGNLDHFRQSSGLGASPELLPLLNMSENEFAERIGPTTAGWIGITRFRRNAAVALGNIGNPAAIPALIQVLEDPDPVIRGHAAWALGKIGGHSAKRALEAAFNRETNVDVIAEIQGSL